MNDRLDAFREAWRILGGMGGPIDQESKAYLFFIAGAAHAGTAAMQICREHAGKNGCDLGDCSSAIHNRIRDEIVRA